MHFVIGVLFFFVASNGQLQRWECDSIRTVTTGDAVAVECLQGTTVVGSMTNPQYVVQSGVNS